MTNVQRHATSRAVKAVRGVYKLTDDEIQDMDQEQKNELKRL